MVKIIVDRKNGTTVTGDGVVMNQISELCVGVQLFVKNLASDCPQDFKFHLSELIQECLIHAVDEAIK